MKANRRITLFGPALCGKRTLMKIWGGAEGGSQVERATILCGSASVPHQFNRTVLVRSATEIVTLGAAVWSIDSWWPIIEDSAAVALVLDSQAQREKANRECVAALARRPALPRIGCLVWTKEDLVTTYGLERAQRSVFEELTSDPRIAGWPEFSTRFDVHLSMVAPVAFLTARLDAERGVK